MNRLITLFALALLLMAGADARGQGQIYPPYDDNYQFGADGDANDPNGKDGWPADHPNNPTPGQAGKGGDGFGTGNGGKGGKGANGSDGGIGGNSGPNGGCGGAGGQGGANPAGQGGTGGRGGNGVDCGGLGGQGGDGSTFGGTGGCGGHSTGGGQAGDGGKGGKATSPGGVGGTGGCGGNSPGQGGCSGSGGDGGNYVPGASPGMPGMPGSGDGDGVGDCGGELGQIGSPEHVAHNGPASIKYTIGLEQLAFRGDDPLEEVVPMISYWRAVPGSEIGVATRRPLSPFQPDGSIEHKLVLHPESLDNEVVRVVVEYRVTGQSPLLSVVFGLEDPVVPSPSIPVPLGDGWFLMNLTVVRPEAGEPMGVHLDMLDYETRDVEVRLFEVHSIAKGDVNFDGIVDEQDLQIVGANMFATGALRIEDGDTDLSGAVDANDALNVLRWLTD